VWLPEGEPGRTPRAGYLVAYGGARFDTVYVDQRQAQGGWHALGVYPYDGGGLGLVQLLGALSEGGEMVASAARWRRTLQTVEAEGGGLPATLALGAPYPNPTRGGVLLPVEASAPGTLRLQVFDLLGRRVAEGEASFRAGLEAVPLDLSHLPAGTYIVRPSVAEGEGEAARPLPARRIILVR
jgi:hypothetical protein